MDPAKEFGPLLGLSLALWFAICALGIFTFLALLLVPFSMLAMRKQLARQIALLERIEQQLAGERRPGELALPQASPRTSSVLTDPALGGPGSFAPARPPTGNV